MAAMRPDGSAIELPIGSRKARGRTLSDQSCRRIRDLLAVQLVRGLGLSVPDAIAVLTCGSIGERQLRNRLNACPASIGRALELMRQEAATGDVA